MLAPGCRKIITRTLGFPPVVREPPALPAARCCDIRDRIFDVRHVPQPHRRAVVVGDNQRPVLIGGKELIVVVDVHELVPFETCPLAWFAFARLSALRTVSNPTPSLFSSIGIHFGAHRGLGRRHPTNTCAHSSPPATVSAPEWSLRRRTSGTVTVSEVSARIRIGASAGLTLR